MSAFKLEEELLPLPQETLLKNLHLWAKETGAGDTERMDLHELIELANRYARDADRTRGEDDARAASRKMEADSLVHGLWGKTPWRSQSSALAKAGVASAEDDASKVAVDSRARESLHPAIRSFRNSELQEPTHPVFEGADVGIQRHWRYFPVALHRHAFFELVCVVAGVCGQQVGNESFELRGGDVLIVPPGTSHAISAFSDGCIVYNMPIKASTFERNFLSLLQARHVLARFFAHALTKRDTEAWMLFRTDEWLGGESLLALIRDEAARPSDGYRREILNTLTKAFLLQLISRFSDSCRVSMTDTEEGRALSLLQAHLQVHFRTATLEEAARAACYSTRQVERMLKRSLGRSFSELVRDLRLGHAATLLRETDLPVGEVAEQAGYASLSAFYSGFRSRYGMSPAVFREEARRG